MKIFVLWQYKAQNFLTSNSMDRSIYYPPIKLQRIFFRNFRYQNTYFWIPLRTFQDLVGVSLDNLIAVLTDLTLKQCLVGFILLLNSENVLIFVYRWTRSSRTFFLISLSAQFILFFNFEKFARGTSVLVMSWPSIFLSHVSVCFWNFCLAVQKFSKTSDVTFHRPILILVFTSLCSVNSCFSSHNMPGAERTKYSCNISGLFWLFFWWISVYEKM